jgi:hypothetical protein
VPVGPLFVGGTGRSGTWALGGLLGAHPRWCAIPTELRFHARARGLPAVLEGRLDPEAFVDAFERQWYRPSKGTGRPKGVQVLLDREELRTYLDAFRERARRDVAAALAQLLLDVTAGYAAARSADAWVETTPDNARAAWALTSLFPRAHVIHVARDGRDVAASVAGMQWGPDTIEEALEWWAVRIRRADEGIRRAATGRAHLVRLEELLYLDRERSLARLLEPLGAAEVPQVRAHFEASLDGARGNLGRWRSHLPDERRRRDVDARYRHLLDSLAEQGVAGLPVDPDVVDELVGTGR